MTANVNKFNKFVLSFLKDTSESDNINELWMAPDIQKQVKSLYASAGAANGRKKNKDPLAPKRGKSGYLFFCSDNREAVKSSLGEQAKATDVTKELGLRWNALKESKKPADKKILTGYEKAAADDKARYQGEKSEYTPPEVDASDDAPKRRGGKRKSAKKGPKRAKSGYLYFCEDRRNQLKTDNPALKSTEITSELGRLWNELKADVSRVAELAKYEGQATEDKSRYESEKSENVNEVKTKPTKKDGAPAAPKKDAPKKDDPKKETAPKKEAPKKGVKKQAEVVEDDDVEEEEEEISSKKSKAAAPSKKLNGYQKYSEVRRPELKAKYTNEKPVDITKRLSDEWKVLSKDEKQKWTDS